MMSINAAIRHCEPRALCVAKQSLLSLLWLVAAWILLSPDSASACPVCAGDPSSPMTAGMNGAISTLLVITGVVLSTFVGFFLFLWRRARAARRTQIDTAWIDGLRGAKNV
jgi:hypothetical protein